MAAEPERMSCRQPGAAARTGPWQDVGSCRSMLLLSRAASSGAGSPGLHTSGWASKSSLRLSPALGRLGLKSGSPALARARDWRALALLALLAGVGWPGVAPPACRPCWHTGRCEHMGGGQDAGQAPWLPECCSCGCAPSPVLVAASLCLLLAQRQQVEAHAGAGAGEGARARRGSPLARRPRRSPTRPRWWPPHPCSRPCQPSQGVRLRAGRRAAGCCIARPTPIDRACAAWALHTACLAAAAGEPPGGGALVLALEGGVAERLGGRQVGEVDVGQGHVRAQAPDGLVVRTRGLLL